MMTNNQQIGYIVGGGLKESFSARLTVDPLTVQEGGFVVIDSGPHNFCGKKLLLSLPCKRRP
jgi:hypothetical protein